MTIIKHILAAKAALWHAFCFTFTISEESDRLCDIVDSALIKIVLRKFQLFDSA